jgi:hypothetical protein
MTNSPQHAAALTREFVSRLHFVLQHFYRGEFEEREKSKSPPNDLNHHHRHAMTLIPRNFFFIPQVSSYKLLVNSPLLLSMLILGACVERTKFMIFALMMITVE